MEQNNSTMPDNAIVIPCKSLKTFFRFWIEFLAPIHKLSSREMDVLAYLLYKRYELSKIILDEDILNKTLFSEDSKKELKKECKITNSYFPIILCNLRKNKAITDNIINPKFIPDVKSDSTHKLMIIFKLN